jgi:serine/threonine protein kinase
MVSCFHNLHLACAMLCIPPPGTTVSESLADAHHCALQLSPEAQHLLHHMFRPNPAERCTTEDIMAHPWFTKNLPPELGTLNDRLLAARAAEHAECRQSLSELDRCPPSMEMNGKCKRSATLPPPLSGSA